MIVIENKIIVKNINNGQYDDGDVVVNFDQFMEIMIHNIITNRIKFKNSISFESGKY